jgi:hypothetical protein
MINENYYIKQSDQLLEKIKRFIDDNNIIELNGKSFKKLFFSKHNSEIKQYLLDELSIFYMNFNLKIELDKNIMKDLFDREDFCNLSILLISNFINDIFNVECNIFFKSEDFSEIFCLIVLKLFNINLLENNFYLFPGICFLLLNNFGKINIHR